MVFEIPPFLQGQKLSKAPFFLQLIGVKGAGCRRMAFEFLKPLRRAAWMSPQWTLYAPLLWSIAHSQHIKLLGIECQDRRRLRFLLKELVRSQVFDALILDDFHLSAGEGFFLQKLILPFRASLKVLVIDERPHTFCAQRVHMSLSHQSFRYFWSKGGDPTPKLIPFQYLKEIQSAGAPCLP